MEGQPSYRIPPPWANRNARRPKEKSSLSGCSCRDSPTLKTTTAQATATDVSTNKRGAATASRLRIAVPEEIAELLIRKCSPIAPVGSQSIRVGDPAEEPSSVGDGSGRR